MTDWNRYSLSLVISETFAGDWGSDDDTDETNVPCVRVADFNRENQRVRDEIPTIRSYPATRIGSRHLKPGDILIEKSGGGEKTPVGSAIYFEGPEGLMCTNFIQVVRLKQDQDPRYWTYAMRMKYANGETNLMINQTTGIQNLDMQEYFGQKFDIPNFETQRRIADYLDKEISEMDALIDNFEALIRELETRKTVLPDSRINYQGASVPTVPAKLLARIKTGEGDTQDAIEDGEFPFYVRSDTVRASDNWTFEGPAVLTSGDGAGVGKIFHYAEGKFRAHQRVYVLKDFKNVDPKYFYWCFQTNFPRQVEHGGAKATVESVRMNMVADTPIPLPPLEKQREIAGGLDSEFEKMNGLIEDSTQLVSLLKERKTALITEVVTGRKEV